MPPRLSPLAGRPISFAHRGARAHAPENTMEAFDLAVRLGAQGIETDVWLTADDEVVLDHDGEIGSWPRRKAIRDLPRSRLPTHIPTLAEFYERVGIDHEVSIDVKDPAAFEHVIGTARQAGDGAEERLWLCHPDLDQLVEWRGRTSAHLVDSTRLSRVKEGAERRAFRLRDLGIDAINMRLPDWTGGLILLFHRYERFAFGWDAQHEREIASLVDSGIDGVFSDHVDRMVDTIAQFFPDS